MVVDEVFSRKLRPPTILVANLTL